MGLRRFVGTAVMVALCVWGAGKARADEPGRGLTARFETQFMMQAIDHHYAALRMTELAAGTDLTREEIELARALRWLKERATGSTAKLRLAARALFAGTQPSHQRLLERLGLAAPSGWNEKIMAALVSLALARSAPPEQTTSRTGATDP